jgi:hypothetical protein
MSGTRAHVFRFSGKKCSAFRATCGISSSSTRNTGVPFWGVRNTKTEHGAERSTTPPHCRITPPARSPAARASMSGAGVIPAPPAGTPGNG